MAKVDYSEGNTALIIDKNNEPKAFLEWLSTHHEVVNPIHRVSSRIENFKIELRVNAALHEEAAEFINQYN